MIVRIRPLQTRDLDEVVALALRAWEPVYPRVNALLGDELAQALHGEDWRAHQAGEVAQILQADGTAGWVAELDGVLAGFVAARVVDPLRLIGEVAILGVDPNAQRRGIATSLTETATAWLRSQGMKVAYVGTGGDTGHEPARHLYERLGFHPFPSAQYFKMLED